MKNATVTNSFQYKSFVMYFPNKVQENHEENFTAFRTEDYIYPPDLTST